MDAFPIADPADPFVRRHLGPRESDVEEMLEALGLPSLEALVDAVIPASIRTSEPLRIGRPHGETELLQRLRKMAGRNRVLRSLIGMGYHESIVPAVIARNVLENPGWYTQYTPYQSEISQGRLEALLNFQTMVSDLTGLPLANASMLDEATAAAEAMTMCWAHGKRRRGRFFAAADCHPQTLEVVATRARPLGIELQVAEPKALDPEDSDLFGVLLQYPTTEGRVEDYGGLVQRCHQAGAQVVVATDLLALALLRPPGEFGADVAVGSSQRFGVPLGYGGPHAAFLAAAPSLERLLPGRIVGLSKDVHGNPACRLARQTREQHIRREKATSNICTAQVLLAVMAGMYAVYHGPRGVRRIAERVHRHTAILAEALRRRGLDCAAGAFFDTLRVRMGSGEASRVLAAALDAGFNLRDFGDGSLGVAVDEKTDLEEVGTLVGCFTGDEAADLPEDAPAVLGQPHLRESPYLTHEVFNRHHSEHEMLRYLHRLQGRDLSLTHSMIPLGSCTMKLNGTSEMLPVTWPEFADLHPFAPTDQGRGYRELFDELCRSLADLTGLEAVSLQPNAGSQGEYTGLLVIRAYHEARGEGGRDVCLIPTSAHGTNPASAVMAGLRVVAVACDDQGNVDLDDLTAKATAHADSLAALMITYPSTHGVFEEEVKRVCRIVHDHGGQVYLDGANMNAQVGLCRPGELGADVCHLNLHKTFCIPHGGGGPGMGPICAAAHLAPHLPGHPLESGDGPGIGAVAAAPWGSPGILPISWMYIGLMGSEGLTRASQVAILNANYMARRLAPHYPILYTGRDGLVAHEFIIDLRHLRQSAGVQVDDVAKRLIDYGFHAPTMSWPVAGTMMIEPTESEPKGELDRFCDAMIAIREEIRRIEAGESDPEDNVLKNAPHTIASLLKEDWSHPYSREEAAFPLPWLREHKFWPAVGRVDNAWGDRHLVCTCPPMEAFAGEIPAD